MDRLQFIHQHWRPYPDQSQVPEEAVCGRIQSLDASSIQVRVGHQTLTLEKNQILTGENSLLGPSCDPKALKKGDWVAWMDMEKQVYLLSPCLAEKAPLFDQSAKAWSQFLGQVEKFFLERDFLHLRTPYLVTSPGVDHHIDFFQALAPGTGRQWTLPTSPEIHLKKFLCQGYEKIFEIKNCFRDDLPGPHHSAEFTMLEWYRAFADLDQIALDLWNLLRALLGEPVTLHQVSVAEVFKANTGFTLTPETTQEELRTFARELKIEFLEDDDWNDLFFRIYMEKLEPQLGLDHPVLVRDFPAQQASLAKINGRGWAERMELYWQGVELANAYLEVNDPKENRARFLAEAQHRLASQADTAPLDEEFFQFLESGMPPAAGIALGLNRLFSLIRIQNSMKD